MRLPSRILWAFICLLTFNGIDAKIKLASPFQDGMVLQQNTKACIWGWAKPSSQVRVLASWALQPIIAQTSAEGRWEISLPTPAGSFTPQSLTISDGEELTLGNILIGEVWLAAGQSNMQMPIEGWNGCPVQDSQKLILGADAYSGKIRMATAQPSDSYVPTDSLDLTWQDCDSHHAGRFSAVAYTFSQTLSQAIDVPIGILCVASGGTRLEAWMPRQLIQSYPDEARWLDQLEEVIPSVRSTTTYNALLHPLCPYTVKGIIWYQGEANVGAYAQYESRLTDFIQTLRTLWQQPDLPFLMVEIAPCMYGGNNLRAALLREAIWNTGKKVSHVSVAGTNDLALPEESHQIHPSHKQEIGQRLAWAALDKVYQKADFNKGYPTIQAVTYKSRKAYVTFAGFKGGLQPATGIQGFELAGKDHVFHPASATLQDSTTVVVSSPQVSSPKYVRYCFQDFLLGNLHSTEGMPATPFRSDN